MTTLLQFSTPFRSTSHFPCPFHADHRLTSHWVSGHSSVTDILTASWCTSHLTRCTFSLMSPVDALSKNPFSPMAGELLDGLPTGPLSAITDVGLDPLSFFDAIPTRPPSWECPSKLFPFSVPFSLGFPPLHRTPLESSVFKEERSNGVSIINPVRLPKV